MNISAASFIFAKSRFFKFLPVLDLKWRNINSEGDKMHTDIFFEYGIMNLSTRRTRAVLGDDFPKGFEIESYRI
jgi:hypothetical protein